MWGSQLFTCKIRKYFENVELSSEYNLIYFFRIYTMYCNWFNPNNLDMSAIPENAKMVFK